MILNLAHDGANAMLDALGKQLDAGVLEILSDGQQVLARLRFASPAGAAAADGQLELAPITEEDAAPNSGNAAYARLLTRSGAEVLSCDVGNRNSDCVIKLSTTAISQGSPVRIDSFRLALP
jgi:hypothetical protein